MERSDTTSVWGDCDQTLARETIGASSTAMDNSAAETVWQWATLESTTCNYCGSARSSLFWEGKDRLHHIGGRYRLVTCLECGLHYLNPRPMASDLARFYPDDYQPHREPASRPLALPWLKWGYGHHKRCSAIIEVIPSGRILDVGCGNGTFLAAMHDRGWDACGVDISVKAIERARLHRGLDLRVGSVEQAGYPDNSFDVVTMWHVLEHTPDPMGTLREIARILRPGGLLAISVPNLESVDARLFGRYWIGLDVPRHLNLFPAATLREALARSGFEVVRERCFFGTHEGFAHSLQLSLEETERGRRLASVVLPLFRSFPCRLLAAPAFYCLDRAMKGTIRSVFSLLRR